MAESVRRGFKTFMENLWSGIKKVQKQRGMSDEELEDILNRPMTAEKEKKIAEDTKAFGKQLKEGRERNGLSLEELSKKAKVPIASIQLLEAGVGEESVETVFAILKVLKAELRFERKKNASKTKK